MEMTIEQCHSTFCRTNAKTGRWGRTAKERGYEATTVKRETRSVKKVQADLGRLAGLRKRKKTCEENDEGLRKRQNKRITVFKGKTKVPEIPSGCTLKRETRSVKKVQADLGSTLKRETRSVKKVQADLGSTLKRETRSVRKVQADLDERFRNKKNKRITFFSSKKVPEFSQATTVKRETRSVKKVQADLGRLAGLRKRKKTCEENDSFIIKEKNQSEDNMVLYQKPPAEDENVQDFSRSNEDINTSVQAIVETESEGLSTERNLQEMWTKDSEEFQRLYFNEKDKFFAKRGTPLKENSTARVDHEDIIQDVPQSSEDINASGAAITENKHKLSNETNSSEGLGFFKVSKVPLSRFTRKNKAKFDSMWRHYYKEKAIYYPSEIEDTALIKSIVDENPSFIRCQKGLTIIDKAYIEEYQKRFDPERAISHEFNSISDEDSYYSPSEYENAYLPIRHSSLKIHQPISYKEMCELMVYYHVVPERSDSNKTKSVSDKDSHHSNEDSDYSISSSVPFDLYEAMCKYKNKFKKPVPVKKAPETKIPNSEMARFISIPLTPTNNVDCPSNIYDKPIFKQKISKTFDKSYATSVSKNCESPISNETASEIAVNELARFFSRPLTPNDDVDWLSNNFDKPIFQEKIPISFDNSYTNVKKVYKLPFASKKVTDWLLNQEIYESPMGNKKVTEWLLNQQSYDSLSEVED